MVNGSSITFKGHGTAAGLLNVAAVVWMHWDESIFQDADGKVYSYVDLPFGQLTELFIFRDRLALASWLDTGLTQSNANLMIYVLLHEGDLTLIIHDPAEPEMQALLALIGRLLKQQPTD